MRFAVAISRPILSVIATCSLAAGFVSAAASAATTNLGVQDYDVAGVQVILLSAKRTSDGYITVKWAYHNTTRTSKKLGENSGVMTGAWSAPYSLSYDSYILANGTQYHVAKGNTLAKTHTSPTYQVQKIVILGPLQTYSEWAKYDAPPADVDKITFSVEGTTPFEDVPLTPPASDK